MMTFNKQSKVSFRPDAAATLGDNWDAFGMMEIKKSPQSNQDSYLVDNDKSVLMTAITTIILRACLEMKSAGQFKEVALPFVIAKGMKCSLYVTMLTDDGIPCVKLVGYPKNNGTARNIDCGKSPSEDRTKLFVALAVLLNKFNNFFDSTKRGKYEKHVGDYQRMILGLKSGFCKSRWEPEKSAGGTSNDRGGGSRTKKNLLKLPQRKPHLAEEYSVM
jgi:hypothetical protein